MKGLHFISRQRESIAFVVIYSLCIIALRETQHLCGPWSNKYYESFDTIFYLKGWLSEEP